MAKKKQVPFWKWMLVDEREPLLCIYLKEWDAGFEYKLDVTESTEP